MKPTIGRIVHVHGRNHNGSTVHPAIVTRVWSDDVINVLLCPDACAPYPLTSVALVDDPSLGSTENPVACWPEKPASDEKPAQEGRSKKKE